jgi:alpha-methylacyl-CoA racemase
MPSESGSGPLRGVKIVEFAGVGPGPFCAMLLADMGAQVICVDRTTPSGLGIKKEPRFNLLRRGRLSVSVDLKSTAGRDVALRMVARSDALLEGNRPGVMERLGLGPEPCWEVNKRLVYGRMTGWGQNGPLANAVGHDLNYLALSGVLSLIGSRDRGPAIPLNLLADFAGGGLYLALGMVSAILEAGRSGRGQIVDAAMLDGLGSLLTSHFGYVSSGDWLSERESNIVDGGAPWYNVYRTSDGGYVSVAAVERKFFDQLLEGMGLDPKDAPDQLDRTRWPEQRRQFTAIFASRTREEWCQVMESREACFAPVLSLDEAIRHPHLHARASFIEVDGVVQPAPAPRFSRTPSSVRHGPTSPDRDTADVMEGLGYSASEIEDLQRQGVIS